jgi:hypothetical protein
MQECLILAVRRYDFKDDGGRRVEGVTLTYLTGDVDHDANRRGQVPLSIGAPVDIWHELQAVPGVYGIDFRQRPGKGGRPTLQAIGVSFLASASLDTAVVAQGR